MFGTIYRQVETFEEVLDSVCVGQTRVNDVKVILFVVLRQGVELSETVADQFKLRIKIDASPRDAPAKVIAVEDIPRTMSGKTAELAVSDQIHGRTAKNTAALANPEALLLFENIRELQR